MNFTKVLKQLSEFLEGRKYSYAVIGGVGLAGYGVPRATVYLDLVLDASAQPEVRASCEKHGLLERYHELEAS